MTRDDVSPFGTYSAEDIARFQGFVTKDGRRGGFCWDEKPRCINAHRFQPASPEMLRCFSTEMIARCHHRERKGGAECRALLYIAMLTFGGSAIVRGTGERCFLVVEITDEHAQRMGQQGMLFLERMALIELALPGTLLDVGVPREVEDPITEKLKNAAEAERRAKEGR